LNVIDEANKGVNEILLYAGRYYIFITENGEYYTEFSNCSHLHPTLERVEEALWDDFAKWEEIDIDEIEEELHQRARDLLDNTEFPALSLDEAIAEGLTNPFHHQQAYYLMDKFEHLANAIEPDVKKEFSPEEVIQFSKNMSQLLYEMYIESESSKTIQFEFDEFLEPIPVEFVEKTLDDPIYMAAMKAVVFYELLSNLKDPETQKFYMDKEGALAYRPELRDYDASFDTYIRDVYARALKSGAESYPVES